MGSSDNPSGTLPELTARQQQVLDFIQDRIDEWGYPPTIREIG
ncbi:MAG: repressor LexA, partial [Myxococcota bacterium]